MEQDAERREQRHEERHTFAARELADRYNRVIAEDLQGLGLSYDLFTRTTTRNHYAVVQEVFRALHANGYVTERSQLSAIDAATGRGLPDRYVEGTCPICAYDGARGDQCDSCGNQLDPKDLINPRSKIDGKAPTFVESAQFFLDLPAFAEQLGGWLQTRKDWRPNVLKFSANLLTDLKPRAISRDLDWGVPIPLPGWRRPRAPPPHATRRSRRVKPSRCSAGRPGLRSGIARTRPPR